MVDWGQVAVIGVGVLGLLNTWVVIIVKRGDKRHELYDKKFEEVHKRYDDKIEGLRARDHDISNQVNSINLLIAGQYLKREEFQATTNAQTAIMEKGFERLQVQLDRISK